VAGEDINIVPLGLRLTNQRTASVIRSIANIITYYKCVQDLMLDTRFYSEAQRVKVASNVGVVEWEASAPTICAVRFTRCVLVHDAQPTAQAPVP